MKLRRLDPDVYVADQLTVADLAILAERGVRSILNNRPEGESEDQPSGAVIEKAARSIGIAYAAAPVAGRDVSRAELRELGRALAALPKPVCAYCRTGVRSMLGWALTSLDAKGVNAVVEAVTGAGFDTDSLCIAITKQTNPVCHKEAS